MKRSNHVSNHGMILPVQQSTDHLIKIQVQNLKKSLEQRQNEAKLGEVLTGMCNKNPMLATPSHDRVTEEIISLIFK